MKQFDVYLVAFDPTIGAEIRKTRPAIIVSPNSMNKYLQTVLVAPLTHTVKSYPSRVGTAFANSDGEVVLDQMRGIDKQRLVKKLGRMDSLTNTKIKAVLQTMFR